MSTAPLLFHLALFASALQTEQNIGIPSTTVDIDICFEKVDRIAVSIECIGNNVSADIFWIEDLLESYACGAWTSMYPGNIMPMNCVVPGCTMVEKLNNATNGSRKLKLSLWQNELQATCRRQCGPSRSCISVLLVHNMSRYMFVEPAKEEAIAYYSELAAEMAGSRVLFVIMYLILPLVLCVTLAQLTQSFRTRV